MLFLELTGVVLIFGVALPVAVGAIRIAAGAVDVAEAALAKAGIVAAIGKTAVAKARTAAGKAPSVECATTVKAAAAESAKSAAPTETPETAAERNRVFGPDGDAHGDRRGCQQGAGQPLSTRKL